MNRFKELIASVPAKPSVVVHLGAGWCKEYEFYKSLSSNRIIFVEPDQQLAEKAGNKFKDSNEVTVIAHAIAPENGRQLLKVTNNRRFSSLLSPAQLLDFYPNVTVTDEIEVEAITLEQLCQEEKIIDETDNLLVVELQGLEKEIFPSLAKSVLHQFKWIIIRSSEQNLYKPASDKTQKNVQLAIRDAGYTVLVFKEDAPPFTNILCIRDEAALENAQLRTRETKLVNLGRKYKNQIAKIKKSLISKSDELAKTQAHIHSTNTEKDKQSQQIKELTESGKEKTKKMVEMQQTLRINNKLLFKSDTDLRDLQLQYRNALQHQEQQHALLCELKEKLGQASEFYHRLNLQNLVLNGDTLEHSASQTVGSLKNDKSEN